MKRVITFRDSMQISPCPAGNRRPRGRENERENRRPIAEPRIAHQRVGSSFPRRETQGKKKTLIHSADYPIARDYRRARKDCR